MARSFSTGQHVFGEGEIMSGDLLPVRFLLRFTVRFTVRLLTLLVIFRLTVTHLTVNLTDIHSISERTDKSGFARDVSPEGSSLQFFRSQEHSFQNLKSHLLPTTEVAAEEIQPQTKQAPQFGRTGPQNRFLAAATSEPPPIAFIGFYANF